MDFTLLIILAMLILPWPIIAIAAFFIIRFRLSKRGQESEGGPLGVPLGKTGITLGGWYVNDFKRNKSEEETRR